MAQLETVIEELKTLSPEQLDRIVDYAHALRRPRSEGLHPAFAATFGGLSSEEAEDWLKAMEECERIDDEPPPSFD